MTEQWWHFDRPIATLHSWNNAKTKSFAKLHIFRNNFRENLTVDSTHVDASRYQNDTQYQRPSLEPTVVGGLGSMVQDSWRWNNFQKSRVWTGTRMSGQTLNFNKNHKKCLILYKSGHFLSHFVKSGQALGAKFFKLFHLRGPLDNLTEESNDGPYYVGKKARKNSAGRKWRNSAAFFRFS